MCVGTKNTVLLQTTMATVYNPGNSHGKMTIGIILDGGSQRSYRMLSVISFPVQSQSPRQAVSNYPHLAGLTLADDCEGEADIDILVGADQYWNFVTG